MGFILSPTVFNNVCEKYREKVEGNPVSYPYWAGKSPTSALPREFYKLGAIQIPRRLMKYCKFLNESQQEISVDGYNANHIPFFYFFPVNNQFKAFDAGSSWLNGYQARGIPVKELEKKFEFIQQFFSTKDWDTFTHSLIWMMYAYGD